MPIGLLIAGAAIATAAGGYSIFEQDKQAKAELDAQKKLYRKQQIAQGASIVSKYNALRKPLNDADPMTPNDRSLYADGGSAMDVTSTGGSGGSVDLTGLDQITGGVLDIAGTYAQSQRSKDKLDYLTTRANIAEGTSRFDVAVEKDNARRDLEWSKSEPTLDKVNPFADQYFANGGNAIHTNSKDTAMVLAGTHESGNDMEFTRPDGSKAKVEGNEGLRDVPGDVQIFSDRLANPMTGQSFAAEFSDLSSLKGGMERIKRSTNDAVKSNTADRKIAGINSELDNLFLTQEAVKDLKSASVVHDEYAWGGGALTTEQKTKLEGLEGKEKRETRRAFRKYNKENKPEEGYDPVKTSNMATGLSLLDNIFNAVTINNYDTEVPTPSLLSKVDLDTEINIDAATHAAKSQLRNYYENVDQNVTSSNVGNTMKLAATANTIKQLNQLHADKEIKETELHNQEVLANLNVDSFNAQTLNRAAAEERQREDNKFSMRSANVANMVDDIAKGLTRNSQYKADKEAFSTAAKSVSAETGIEATRINEAAYDTFSKQQVKTILDAAVAGGKITPEDYISLIEGHNKRRSGKKLKVPTKDEVIKTFGLKAKSE